ncbi:MAG: transposase [Cyanobacteria bacterium]|nr:transposase [Cyanobacteriota bacterium]
MANHPHRLPKEHYIGRRKHFLTACTYMRRERFRDAATCVMTIDQLLRACRKHGFVIIAYVLMPDHIHVLIEGLRDDSDFVKWLNLFRQLTGYWEKHRTNHQLWEEGYWDYTLRDDDPVPGIASYIVWNPVEARLVARPELYPYAGSQTATIAELAAVMPYRPPVGDPALWH